MEKTQLTVTELSSLLRMMQVIPDADNVGRIHRVLLAFCTAWSTIGVRRAFLLLVDEPGRMLRGHLAAQRGAEAEQAAVSSFESLARRVVESARTLDASDLTLRTRTFSVPLEWQRCGVAKCAGTGVPLLADRSASEFGSDPFFDFFGTRVYIAIPLRVRGGVSAVLAADNDGAPQQIAVEDISLVYSMAQQASTAIERLLDNSDNARRFRVLRKLQDILAAAADPRRFGDALSAMLTIISRAMGGDGALVKDLVRNRVTHVKSVSEDEAEDRASDVALTDSFDDVMERVANSGRAMRGDSGHALLNDAAAGVVRHFLALPLVAGGECLGSVLVYAHKRPGVAESGEFAGRDRLFLELCAGMLGERLDSLYREEQILRSERMLEEVQSNLVRERASARVGARAQEEHEALAQGVRGLRELVGGRQPFEKRVTRVREALDALDEQTTSFRDEVSAMKSDLHLVDLFAVVREAVDAWAPNVMLEGVEVTSHIPSRGPVMLMDRDSVTLAFNNILGVLAAHVGKGDRVLVECSSSDGRAVVLVADTAGKVDGTLLSRLFMPFTSGPDPGASESALSAAGDILQRHSGEITVKSSPSWRTILALSFPVAANAERRTQRKERRRRRERRGAH